ncbi:nuclease, partial [Heyndrickxia sporothermodurans]
MTKERYINVRKSNYTQVGNGLLWDKNVTLQAKGLLSIFLSNTESWKLNMREVFTRSKNGRDAQFKVVNELIEHGYFARVEIRNEKNQFEEMVYIFSDNKSDVAEALKEFTEDPFALINPDKKKKKTEKKPNPENQDTEVKDTENQDTEIEDTGNQDNNNINLKNTKGNNT